MNSSTNKAGAPDNSFGEYEDGVVIEPVIYTRPTYQKRLEEDGNFITLGRYLNPATLSEAVIFKYSNTGFFNNTYGIKRPTVDVHNFEVCCFLVQDKNKLLMLGSRTEGQSKKALVARFLAHDGQLDASFGDGGVRLLDEVIKPAYLGDNFIQPQYRDQGLVVHGDRIVVAFPSEGDESKIICLNSSGHLIDSFGNSGVVTSPHRINALGVQTSGNIVVAGQTNERKAFLSRHNAIDGSEDKTFGVQGYVEFEIEGASPAVLAIAIMDNHIVAVGDPANQDQGPSQNAFITRVMPEGKIDPSFNNGRPVISIGLGTYETVILQPDGKPLTATAIVPDRSLLIYAMRYRVDGTPDPVFGNDGVALAYRDIQGRPDGIVPSVRALELQPDKKIVISGYLGATVFLIRLHGE